MTYEPLTEDQKNFHLTGMISSGIVDGNIVFFPISGIFPSGEANFADLEQYPKDITYNGYNGYSIVFSEGSSPLSNESLVLDSSLIILGVEISPTYSSGDVLTSYTHYAPDPSGGTGELDKLQYNVSFDPNSFLIKNSG